MKAMFDLNYLEIWAIYLIIISKKWTNFWLSKWGFHVTSCREEQSQGDSAQFPYGKSSPKALKVIDFRVVPS